MSINFSPIFRGSRWCWSRVRRSRRWTAAWGWGGSSRDGGSRAQTKWWSSSCSSSPLSSCPRTIWKTLFISILPLDIVTVKMFCFFNSKNCSTVFTNNFWIVLPKIKNVFVFLTKNSWIVFTKKCSTVLPRQFHSPDFGLRTKTRTLSTRLKTFENSFL